MIQPTERFAALVDALAGQGWAVSTSLLPLRDIEQLAAEARDLFGRGKFRRAGVGRSAEHLVRPEVRSDYILWVDGEIQSPAVSQYLSEIDGLRLELNRELFAGLGEFEAHYAIYPPGAFYKKHVDRFVSADERAISCTLYLNRDWRDAEGGALRLYVDGGAAESPVDVYPRAGTFVMFRSELVYHEVLPASRERLSITGWLKRRSLLLAKSI